MNYYIYENWQRESALRPIIHKWDCGHCHMGLGKHEKADKGENGVWVGPFNTIPQAKKIASKILTDKGITKCEICLKTK